jgi:hypothetical protein
MFIRRLAGRARICKRGRAKRILRGRTRLSGGSGAALGRDERAELESRSEMARALAGGEDVIARFLNWKLPPADKAHDGDAVGDDAGEVDDDDDAVDD